MAYFLKVPRSEGEKMRIFLSSISLLDTSTAIESNLNYVYLPLLSSKKRIPLHYPIVKFAGRKINKKPRNIYEALKNTLSKKELSSLVKSFDIIGDVAVLEIPDSLKKHEKAISKAVMAVHPNIKCVVKKMSGMEGDFRVRKIKVIGGRRRTQTSYKESGVRMFVDISKMYFSVRLATERKRIASLVGANENILVFFSGCCPFPLIISKFNPTCNIVAIELNQAAHNYALKNIALNKMRNITAILGDVREVVPKNYSNFADRIVMPLPKGGENFLDVAFLGARKGCVVHFYAFGPKENPYKKALEAINKTAKMLNKTIRILNKKVVRPYAPGIVQAVIDFKIL